MSTRAQGAVTAAPGGLLLTGVAVVVLSALTGAGARWGLSESMRGASALLHGALARKPRLKRMALDLAAGRARKILERDEVHRLRLFVA